MPRVLIIDGEQGTRDSWAAVLQHVGFDVTGAATRMDGLAVARANAFDAILVDCQRPDPSGVDIVRALTGGGVTAPVVVITPFPTFDTAFDAARSGAAGYVDGPLLGEELVDVVYQACQRRHPVRHPSRAVAFSRPVSHFDARVRETIRMIDANLTDPPSSHECAATVGMSASGLRHLFRKTLGISPKRYHLERRLQVVSVRLREEFDDIGQIASALGFRSGSLRDFRREFKRRFGMSPTQYRALCGRRQRAGP